MADKTEKLKTHPTVVTTDDPKPPKHGTPEPVEPGGKVPRVVKGTDRAIPGSGLKRFRIRCDTFTACKTRYILAKTEEDAIKFYSEQDGIPKLVENAKKEKPNFEPVYDVRELPD